MSPEEAALRYSMEWPALNEAKEIAVAKGDLKAGKRARQALGALSDKYSDRHVVEPTPPTLEERVEWLEGRVAALERG